MLEKLANFFNNTDSKFVRDQRQFIEHWSCVTSYLQSEQGKAGDVYNTPASEHIAEMIYMIERDVAAPGSDYGPCVEHILENEVLGTLEQHARADVPAGLRRLVLNFFSQLLQKLQMSAIPHINISKPFREMVAICGGGLHPIDEIHFISSILGKFHQDPSLVNLFLSEAGRKGKEPVYEFRLIDALLSLTHSEEERVAMRSCEGLLLCCSLDSSSAMELIMTSTILIMDLVSRLCQRYSEIRQHDVVYINNSNVRWNSQHEQYLWEGYEMRIIKLLGWLDYLNTLTTTSHIRLTTVLLQHIRESFLSTHLLKDLQSSSSPTVIKALVVLHKMIQCITSELFMVEVLEFLTTDEVIGQLCTLLNSEDTEVVEKALLVLSEMVSTHHSVVIETLILHYTRTHSNVSPRLQPSNVQPAPQLKRTISSDSGVDDMLLSDEESSNYSATPSYNPEPSPQPISTASPSPNPSSESSPGEGIVRSELASEEPTTSRECCQELPNEQCEASTSNNEHNDISEQCEASTSNSEHVNEHCEAVSEHCETVSEHCEATTSECNEASEYGTECTEFSTSSVPEKFSPEPEPFSAVCLVPNLADSVQSFLSLMPEYTQQRLAGYSEYLHDAHLQVQEGVSEWCWVSQLVPEAGDTSHEPGVLLRALINMAENIPYQTYSVNLLLMSILSEICYIPHPSVTVYMLDTTLPAPTLYTQLKDVAATFSDILAASPTLEAELKNVTTPDCLDVCRAVYLTEEFCKELAAISLIKSC